MSIVAFPAALAFALWFQLTYEPSYWMRAFCLLRWATMAMPSTV
ncbi:hypothetical protein [Mesorhizobium sp.]|nr:hypothetical protein [Mesorhizobium sp.]